MSEREVLEVPSALLLQWLIEGNQVSSDVELAILSNVCRSWRQQVSLVLSSGRSKSPLLLPSMVRYAAKKKTQEEGGHSSGAHPSDSFCAAWFYPDGVQTIPVSAEQIDTDNEGTTHNNHNIYRPSTASHGIREAVFEWRGYRHASQVLAPFGYAAVFVDSFLSAENTDATKQHEHNKNSRAQSEEEKETLAEETESRFAHKTTAAVRGATYARPEGYCGCWDDSHTAVLAASSNHSQYSQVMREQRRGVLQRQLLPRIIYSALKKDMLNPSLAGKRQTAVQCLNASGSSAVRLFTPPFSCGPLTGRITIFCVGVATEDGCFLSGLKRRCEFGHMYPQSERNNLIDMSPVCIATDAVKANARRKSNNSEGPHNGNTSEDNQQGEEGGNNNENENGEDVDEEDDDDDDDDDDSSADQCGLGEEMFGCKCPFNPSTDPYDTDNDEMKPPDVLHRGQRGPGQWHCYVAIVDGIHSTIRVDGAEESMDHLCRDEDKVDRARVLLDGLTIGSDHSFDMSLCFGEGAPAEGEGAISEIAVFQGRLPTPDIEALEQSLMKKHGISRTAPGMGLFLQQEDEWKRDSRALIEQSAPYHMTTEGVPLRVVAKDPSVAWHRTNEVTGENIQVGRIGSRLSNGSSDW